MLTELSTKSKVTGAKQVKRALEAGKALRVFLAQDADPRIIEPIEALCGEKGVETVGDCSMADLGKACGISVGAAVAALVRE